MKGNTPESIIQSFLVLKLEQVYGAIAFYLSNKTVIDTYLKAGETEFEKPRQAAQEQNQELYAKLAAYR
ncbi:MAG TPA: hypothetical protein VK184_01610 [Nostocaceae cyanobacterium]|nr:hypothetical protein [Nostocaceae cyanobacterium]